MKTTVMGIVGGTASALGGGKFSNGTMTGAFVHMFNHEAKTYIKGGVTKEMRERAKYYTKEERMARGETVYDTLQRYSKPMMAAGVTGIAVLIGGVVLEAGYVYMLENSVFIVDTVGTYIPGTGPVNSLGGVVGVISDKTYGTEKW